MTHAPILSIRFGGRVPQAEIDGKIKKLKTYCLFYQNPPHKHGILCYGISDYPACPDLSTCLSRRLSPQRLRELDGELKKKADEDLLPDEVGED